MVPPNAVGVPEIKPVVALMLKPAGRAGEIVYVTSDPPVDTTVGPVKALPTSTVPELADKVNAGAWTYWNSVVQISPGLDGFQPLMMSAR